MLQQFTPPKSTNLTRVKVFSLRDLWLFLLGIIFVSVTSGSIGAFMLGIGAEEFFLGESDNIVVVTQPGITTPFTGQVPLSLQSDIQRIPGVLAISPETLGLSVAQNLNDKSIVIRGVNVNYTSLVSSNLIEGSWFNPQLGSPNSTVVNGAVAGYILAENLGLSTGDKLLLASTLTDVVVEIIITGIIRTDSPSDEELIVSLSIGQTMTGKVTGYVSFLRVLIDTDVITKDQLSNFLTFEFLVPISLKTDDPDLLPIIQETPIIAYTPTGQHVKTQYIEEGNTTFFYLRFGTYEFVAYPPNARSSEVLRIFVDQIYLSPFELTIGSIYHNVHIQVQHNQQPADNATVFLSAQYGCQYSDSELTNDSGIVFFPHVPETRYQIAIEYHNISYRSSRIITKSSLISIHLESSISLIVRNYTTNEELDGGNLSVFLLNNTMVYNTTNYISNDTILLYPGEYRIEYQYLGFSNEIIVTVDRRVIKTIFLGTDILHVWIRNTDGFGVPANVSVIRSNQTIFSQDTDLNGTIDFTLDIDVNYTLTAILNSNQSKIHERHFYFSNKTEFIINFYNRYTLDIHTFNGTMDSSSFNNLSDCYIELHKNSSLMTSGTTNASGNFRFLLPDPANYSVTATKGSFSWKGYILIENQTTSYNIPLGPVRLLIFTHTVSNFPVNDVDVTLYNPSGYIQTYYTNASGLIDIIVPIGNYSLFFSTECFFSLYDINLTTSQIKWINNTVEKTGNLTLTLENQFYQNIDNAYVILQNTFYHYEARVFTDNNGRIILYDVPWGAFSISIIHDDITYPKQKINIASEEVEITLFIDTDGPIISAGHYPYWQGRSFSVVWSSEFVSGFLETTLSLITTTLTTLVIIVSVLSLLSIASIISHPIVANKRTIITFQYLGANRQQILFTIVFQLVVLGLVASIIGGILGMWGMTLLPQFQHINIGGVIIRPRVDFWLLLAILISNIVVIAIKAAQKTNEIYSNQLPEHLRLSQLIKSSGERLLQ